MAIATAVAIQQSAIFTPRDLRDPVGVWGARLGVTGDATAGSIKVQFQVPAELNAAYVYTCYGLTIAALTVDTANGQGAKARLLTNWPNVDPAAGVQGFATVIARTMTSDSDFTGEIGMPNQPLLSPEQRFLVLYDPRPAGGVLTIVELELGSNVNTATYSFETYGYFWDRAVMQTPGGLRHPGSE